METPVVTEAIRRMPAEMQDARLSRQTRATIIDAQRQILPKEEWMTYEEVSAKGGVDDLRGGECSTQALKGE